MSKQAFEPLLPPGKHILGLSELHSLCVDRFPASIRREQLFAEIERLVHDLKQLGIVGELWIDGSFLTAKENPDDVDLSLSAWGDDFDQLDVDLRNQVINALNGGKKYSPLLDTYVCFRFLPQDIRYKADKSAYWAEKWGVGWDGWLKGFVVLKLGESNVWHRQPVN